MDNVQDKDIIDYSTLISKGYALLQNDDEKYKNVQLDNTKMSIMLFTSGTTSISKAVMLSQYNICSDIYALSQMTDIRKEDVFLSFLPLHHTFESTCTFLYGTSCGLTVAFSDGLRYISNNLKEFNVTGFVSVPLLLEIMYKKIDKAIEEQGKKKLVKTMSSICNFLLKFGIDIRRKVFKSVLDSFAPNLRILIAGGAPMSKDAINCFVGMGINLLQGYGLTETSPVLAGENDKYKRAGSVGFALPGITVEIDNPNDEGIGEIIAKGPTIMSGYYQNEEATNEVLKNGWFYTGDLGYIDKDGYIFITGRKKDVIVLKNGKNIYPEELEILINKLPYVSESLVFGKPDTKKDDLMLSAKIVYNKEIMEETFKDKTSSEYHDLIWQDIKEQVNKQMPAYKAIREIIVTDEPLIKTTTQKVKRFEEIKKIQEQS
jgi:long-chain acyl-CoA synthetase